MESAVEIFALALRSSQGRKTESSSTHEALVDDVEVKPLADMKLHWMRGRSIGLRNGVHKLFAIMPE